MGRTSKPDKRLAAYADVDEANSATGVAIAAGGLPDEIPPPADRRGAQDIPGPAW
ncbi:ATP:cob(I)alamin adenosyltransferase [Streptosporangium sp. NPDC006007]|uniref:ATP:cob(I)alamin adenosyltransferase n=1 Tax=Streptosporangium sp. NPDC006007 TaxID=3154575 RepID=UPI0033A6AB9C